MDIVIRLVTNAIFIAWGSVTIFIAFKDKKRKFYHKWVWISELALGIAEIIFSFTIWFV